MCGIAGILEVSGASHDQHVQRMETALAHRGPDDRGFAPVPTQPGIGRVLLAHRRLSILDLSAAGHQPMRDEVTGNVIVYNGEIYNYRQLRRELQTKGVEFTSDCDTEVVLKGYGVWGVDVLRRLRGMFAFGLVDGRAGTILLARDRLGIKPLYYARAPRPGVGLLFASEVRGILASGLIPRTVCAPAVAQYLVNGYVPDPLTLVDGVESLLPGHYAHFDATGVLMEMRRFWDPGHPSSGGHCRTRGAAAALVRTVLEEIVEQHMISDVPLGAFLSGGIDSSALVALMTQRAPGQVETFSLVFDDPHLSEEIYSRAVARTLKTRHHECRITEAEFLGLMDDALAALDQPTTDGVNSYVVSRKCREAGLAVALAGTGGDELFGGYQTFSRVPRSLRVVRALGALRPALRRPVRRTVQRLLLGSRGYNPSAGLRAKLAALVDLPADALRVYHLMRMVLLPRVVGRLVQWDGAFSGVGRLPLPLESLVRGRAAGHSDLRAQVSIFEQMLYLSNQLLRDTDCVSMAVALEVRVPLLDHVLVETVEALPPMVRFDHRCPKRLLIDAVRDILPPAAYQRRKQGFVLPLGRWLAGPLRERVRATLADPSALAAAGLEPDSARAVVADCFAAGQRIYFTRLWGLYVLVDWCRRHGMSFGGANVRPGEDWVSPGLLAASAVR